MLSKQVLGYIIISICAICTLAALVLIDPIIQDPKYHSFADERTVFGIQNFWNVISNIPFLIVGVLAMMTLVKKNNRNLQLLVFFLGVTLVSLGSGYYHYHPTSQTLVWDRLPMTIAFMGLFSFVISDYLNEKIGRLLLIPLLILGLASIVYWVMFDDLRMYVFVQFFPILVIPVILIFFGNKNSKNKAFWLLLVFYFAAKVFEYFDFQSYEMMKLLSGHSLKHIFASIGIYVFYRLYTSKLINKV